MPNDTKAVELQTKWNENRYEIIDRLDETLLAQLRSETPNYEVIGKLAPARLMFFQEFLTLAALSGHTHTDEVMNAYTFARGEGGNA